MACLYNNNSMETKFIKNLLASSYVPTVPIWKPGRPIKAGMQYISNKYILKANYDGTPDDENEINYDKNDNYFTIIDRYIEGKHYEGITSNYVSNTGIYDSNTHYHLGLYLRYLKDIKNINLMSLYNCWDGSYSDRLRLKRINKEYTIVNNNKLKDGLRALIVPVGLNKTYTIYSNCNSVIKTYFIFYDSLQQIKGTHLYDVKQHNYCSFKQPIKLNTSNLKQPNGSLLSDRDISLNEYLCMVIEIPDKYSSNVVVLEDEISKNCFTDNRISSIVYGDLTNLTDEELDKYCTSYPKLLTSMKNSYAYSDRLIEYLLLNVITNNDDISDNIKRVQEYMSSYICRKHNKNMYENTYIQGVWDNGMRLFLFDLATKVSEGKLVFDINGFVDKDIESMILRGQDA